MNWHATPFEERLEKALSEESVISQRYAFLFKLWFLLEQHLYEQFIVGLLFSFK